jgi:hypothetical protein
MSLTRAKKNIWTDSDPVWQPPGSHVWALRTWTMGDDAYERAARPDEIAAMAALVREPMTSM